jgi:hypothetical protein
MKDKLDLRETGCEMGMDETATESYPTENFRIIGDKFRVMLLQC